jgi:hypothetical protein
MTEKTTATVRAEQETRPTGKSVPPSIESEAFCCPHCGALTHQFWYNLYADRLEQGSTPFFPVSNWVEEIEKNEKLENKDKNTGRK